jgi:crossover junction endodeoxyribonuclease RuvC
VRRILGIDPGSRVTGYAILDSDGRHSRHIASGCIRLDTDAAVPLRLGDIFNQVADIVERYQPDELAIEQVFVAKNAGSALKLGQARGAAICAAVTRGLAVNEYSARMVKQSVVGSGAADKQQVQQMVRLLLNIQTDLAVDQSDALAVALAHAHSFGLNQQLLAAGGRR